MKSTAVSPEQGRLGEEGREKGNSGELGILQKVDGGYRPRVAHEELSPPSLHVGPKDLVH